jgi:hypothetical protein
MLTQCQLNILGQFGIASLPALGAAAVGTILGLAGFPVGLAFFLAAAGLITAANVANFAQRWARCDR